MGRINEKLSAQFKRLNTQTIKLQKHKRKMSERKLSKTVMGLGIWLSWQTTCLPSTRPVQYPELQKNKNKNKKIMTATKFLKTKNQCFQVEMTT